MIWKMLMDNQGRLPLLTYFWNARSCLLISLDLQLGVVHENQAKCLHSSRQFMELSIKSLNVVGYSKSRYV